MLIECQPPIAPVTGVPVNSAPGATPTATASPIQGTVVAAPGGSTCGRYPIATAVYPVSGHGSQRIATT